MRPWRAALVCGLAGVLVGGAAWGPLAPAVLPLRGERPSAVARFTAAAYVHARPTLAWGATGAGPGAFHLPIDIALGLDDAVYVLDYGFLGVVDGVERYREARVQRFDRQGRFVAAWGAGQLDRPIGLAVGPDGAVWVADTFHHLIRRYTPDGALRATWGGYGTALGQLDRPTDLALDAAGNVYVVEFGNHRVQVFGPDGTPRAAWGGAGAAPGQLRGPHGVAVDGQGVVYVADTNNHRIAAFTSSGALLAVWQSAPAQDPACPPPTAGQLCRPRHLAIDPAGNLLVADRNHHRVQVFTPDGRPLASIGGEGDGPGELRFPYGVAVSPDGLLYIADTAHNRIQIFTLGPAYRLHLPAAAR